MTIKRINIISFGGLKNFSIDLENGFNVIYGENENGKTTVMAFIKMMFYGSDKGGSQISKNIRKKYTPWDGSPMAGNIEFELGGRNYRLEREFRASNSSDKIFLTDLDLGTKSPAESDVGNKLFGLSAAAFERSIFIGQFGFPQSDPTAESEINARLSNMASTGEENTSFELVNSRLSKPRFALSSKSGKTGEYDKNLAVLADLKRRYELSVEAEREYSDGKTQLLKYKAETDEMVKNAEIFRKKLSKEQDIRNAEKLKYLLNTKAELENLREKTKLSDGTFADETFLRKVRFCQSKLETAQKNTKAKENEADLIRKQLDAALNSQNFSDGESAESINDSIKQLNEKKASLTQKTEETENKISALQNKLSSTEDKKTVNLPLLFSGVALLIAVAVLFVLSFLIPAVSCGAVSVILLILSFILKPKTLNTKSALQNEISSLKSMLSDLKAHKTEIEEQIFSKKAKLEAITLSANKNADWINSQHTLLSDLEKEAEKLKADEETEKVQLSALLSLLGTNDSCDVEALLSEIAENADKQKALKQKINFLLGDLGGISYEEAEEKLKETENSEIDLSVDFQKLKSDYANLSDIITDRRSREATVTAELKNILSTAETPDVLEREIKELEKTIEKQKNFCLAADIAMETLLESFAETRKSFGSALEKTAAEIFARITGNKYQNMTVSKSFDINVEAKGMPISRESDYLSSGTVDQAYLSLRLAVSKMLSGDGTSLPILLDDSLAQYDDKRLNTAINFLKDYSKDTQIIMFTCHNSISNSAETKGANKVSF